MQILKEKSLDAQIVKKVLNSITNDITQKDVGTYLNTYFLPILNFWFVKGYRVVEFPLQLFDLDDRALLEKHMKWLVSTDILWRCRGNVKDSDVLQQAKAKLGISETKIIEVNEYFI